MPPLSGNHPSFNLTDDKGGQPARNELQELVDAGFGRLFASRADAEAALGGPCHPAPLGDVVKLGAGGWLNTALYRTSDETE